MTDNATDAPIERVYFDTSILWQHRWPSLSGPLTGLAQLAKRKNIELCLPAPVRTEHRLKWVRESMEAWRGAQLAMDKARRLATVVDAHCRAPQVGSELLDETAVGTRYDAAEQHAVTQAGMTTAAYPPRAIEWFVTAATRRLAPFDKNTDRGFRDAVIFQSVLNDLKVRPIVNGRAVLLSQDGDLKGDALRPQVLEAQVPLDVLTSIDQLQTALQAQLTADEKDRWRERAILAERFVTSQDLSELRERIMFGLRDKDVGAVKVLYIADVRIRSTGWFNVSPPAEELPADISISFLAEAAVLGTLSAPPFTRDTGAWFLLRASVDALATVSVESEPSDLRLSSIRIDNVFWLRDGEEQGEVVHREQIKPPLEL